MAGQQGHCLNQGLDDKEVVLVLRVGELQAVAEFRNAMLNLDAGINFHEVVTVAVNDTFKSRS